MYKRIYYIFLSMHAVTAIPACKCWLKRSVYLRKKSKVKNPDFIWFSTTEISIFFVCIRIIPAQ